MRTNNNSNYDWVNCCLEKEREIELDGDKHISFRRQI